MKIYCFNIKKIYLILFITIILVISSILINKFNYVSFAVELSKNSLMSSRLINKITTITQSNEKVAYLTFDDGPSKNVTPKILDILKEENVKASFFVLGKKVEESPEIIKRMYNEGHYIANHGYDHNNSNLYKNSDSFIEEINKTDTAIANALGISNYYSHVFRFPNGFMSPINKSQKKEAVKLLSEMNYAYIDWNCLNNDSVKKTSPQQLLVNLKKSAKNKNTLVVLMHDTNDVNDSSKILKESIQYLKNEGYKFNNFYNLLD